ncbi:MAG: substrate-binding domain-containing protein, partial [Acidobacteriota bacterium]|nr:substrate-binding domain-containing protein [Acidobacteriota bacterium]
SLGGKPKMIKHFGRRVGVLLVAAGLFSTLAVTSAGASATLTGDLTFASSDAAASLTPAMGGSTFDLPFFSQAIQTFETQAANLSGSNAPASIPSYAGVGSTSGKKGVIAGTYAVGASDVPMGTTVNGTNLDSSLLTNADAAHTLTNYVQIPVVLGGVAMMYNLPMLNAKYKKYPVVLSSAILASIYDGQITSWNNSRICKLNPNIAIVKKNKKGKVFSRKCALPNLAITPVFRADGSGTSFIFSNYLNATQGPNYKTSSGAEVYPSTTFNQGQLPSDAIGGIGNPGVATDITSKVGAIGYVEYAFVLTAKATGSPVSTALIVNAKGQRVAISPASVAADAAAFSSTPPTEGSNGEVQNFSIVNGNAAGAYPIAGFSWAIVRQDWNNLGTVGSVAASLNSEKLVAKFLDWCVQTKGGQVVARNNGYVPLPSYLVTLAESQIASMTYNKASLGLS